jgi:hypothetical protein
MDTSATQKVYPVNDALDVPMETDNKDVDELSNVVWRDLTAIHPV